MTPSELSQLADAIEKSLDGWAKEYLDKQTSMLPHLIRDEVQKNLNYYARDALREIVKERVGISITLKEDTF